MLTKEEAIDVLYDVLDPEIKINIYDLGMIYDIRTDANSIALDITLTSAGCPLAATLEDDIVSAFKEIDHTVSFNWVWIPAWGVDRITPEGREQLSAIGFPMALLEKSTWKKRTKEDFNE